MRYHRNVYIWYLTTFFGYAAFILPIWVIFNTEYLGLSNTEAFILGVLPYGLSSIFEIPTGAWADKYGRARIYQLGTILYLLSVGSYVVLSGFFPLLIFQILGGLGHAMQSGAPEALVHDSLPAKDKDEVYSKLHGRKIAILFTGRVATVLVSGYLYSIDPKLPFIAAVVAYLIGLAISLFFVEVRLESPTENSSFAHMKETIKIMRSKPLLVRLTALVGLYSLISEALFSFYQPYFKSIEVDIGEFGIFYAIISAFSIVGALTITYFAKRYNAFLIMFVMMLAILFTLSLMLLEIPQLMYLVIIPSSIAFGFLYTLQNTITQKMVTSQHQATALSIASLVRTAGLLVSVIVVGVLLDLFEPHQVNQLLTIIGVILLLPFIASLRQKIVV